MMNHLVKPIVGKFDKGRALQVEQLTTLANNQRQLDVQDTVQSFSEMKRETRATEEGSRTSNGSNWTVGVRCVIV